MRRAINSGNDLFFLLVMFIAAIGLGSDIIRDEEQRKVVLSALEAGCVLAFLLRAQALTDIARAKMYKTTRRFLGLLKNPMFRTRQKSEWSIYKFHMLMHIINWTFVGRGAPGCTNSSTLEAALKMYISRIASHASAHQDIQKDIRTNYTNHAVYDLLKSAGGAAAVALADAYERPMLNRQALHASGRARESFAKPCVDAAQPKKREVPKPSAEVIKAIEMDMVQNAGILGIAPQAAPLATAQWFGCACISRPEEHFDAPVSLSATVALSSRSADPDPVDSLDDPARARHLDSSLVMSSLASLPSSLCQ